MTSWFRLPGYVLDVLKKDAYAHKLHILDYLQMLLHKRYEDLAAEGRERGSTASRANTPSPTPSNSGRR